MNEQNRKTVGLALGSGSDRGIAHIGVIQTLLKNNIPIDYISGTSIGSIIGAYYSLFLEVDSLEQIFRCITKKKLVNIFSFGLFKENSILNNKKFFNIIKYELFSGLSFDDTKIPLRIPATNLDNGEKVVFKEGKISDAVLSSISIPGVLPVVKIGKADLVDGGLVDAIPVDLLQEFKPDIIIAVDLYNYELKPKDNYKISDVLDRSYKIFMSNLSKNSLDENDKNCIVIKPDMENEIGKLSFKDIDKKIQAGVLSTKLKIEEIKKLLE
jgi:NTE family protein